MKSTLRPIASGAVLLAVGLALAGCESFAGGPAAVQISSEGVLTLAVCYDMVLEEIDGTIEYLDRPGQRETFFDLSGSREISEGELFSLGSIPSGLSGMSENPSVEGARRIFFSIGGSDVTFSALFLNDNGLVIPTDHWLHTNGTLTDSPCE